MAILSNNMPKVIQRVISFEIERNENILIRLISYKT